MAEPTSKRKQNKMSDIRRLLESLDIIAEAPPKGMGQRPWELTPLEGPGGGGGLGGYSSKGSAAAAKPSAPVRIEPTLQGAPKPKIDIKPGETPAQAIQRAQQATAPQPQVMKTHPDRIKGELSRMTPGKPSVSQTPPPATDKSAFKKSVAGHAAAAAAAALSGAAKTDNTVQQEPGPGQAGSPGGVTAPIRTEPTNVELVRTPPTPAPAAQEPSSPKAEPDIAIDKTAKPTTVKPIPIEPEPTVSPSAPAPSAPAPTTKISQQQPAIKPGAEGGPTKQQGTAPIGTPYDIEKEVGRKGAWAPYNESLLREFETYLNLKSQIKFSRK